MVSTRRRVSGTFETPPQVRNLTQEGEVQKRCVSKTAGVLILGIVLAGCGGTPPATLGVAEEKLAPCPPTPICVHTADGVPEGMRRITLDPQATYVWEKVQDVVAQMPRMMVITSTDNYLHAEETSRIFRYVDDLELFWLPDERSELVVRSASRLGRGDLGVNRRRVERFRRALGDVGVLVVEEPGVDKQIVSRDIGELNLVVGIIHRSSTRQQAHGGEGSDLNDCPAATWPKAMYTDPEQGYCSNRPPLWWLRENGLIR